MTKVDTAVSWAAGHTGMPPLADVWVYLVSGEDEHVQLLRGRFDPVFDEFREAATGRLWTGKVLCWTRGRRQPGLSVAAIEAFVAGMALLATGSLNDELLHMAEDWLYRTAMEEVSADWQNGCYIADAVLKARAIKYTRYFS